MKICDVLSRPSRNLNAQPNFSSPARSRPPFPVRQASRVKSAEEHHRSNAEPTVPDREARLVPGRV